MQWATSADESRGGDLLAELRNAVYIGSAFAGTNQLAILVDPPLSVEPDDAGSVIVSDRSGVITRTSFDELRRTASNIGNIDVALAVDNLPDDIEELLIARGFVRRFEGQVSGFWFERDDEIPAEMPTHGPTGAVLPGQTRALDNATGCLDLVEVDYRWLPLSEAGVHSYAHSQGLWRGETWRFVPIDTPSAPWPTVYVAARGELVHPAEIRTRYGPTVSERARDDFPSVQVRLSRADEDEADG